MKDDMWLSTEEAYARRNEYAPDIRERIVEMMRKERIHRVKMRQPVTMIDRSAAREFYKWLANYYRSVMRHTPPATGTNEDDNGHT